MRAAARRRRFGRGCAVRRLTERAGLVRDLTVSGGGG